MEKNLNSVIKKNKSFQASRKELMKSSPIPWLVLLIATLIAAAFLIWPNASDWMEKTKELKAMETDIPTLEQERQSLTNKLNDLNKAFDTKAEEYLLVADQRFPEEIDTAKLAQIVEIYAILMDVHYRSNTMKLNSLSVGSTQNVDGAGYAETSVNINVLLDREMLENFIAFLKTSQVTNSLRNKILDSDNASLNFLDLNKLPVGRINLLSLNEESSRDKANAQTNYNAQIQVFFYSQPL